MTFWQVTADLPFAAGVPEVTATPTPPNTVNGWNAVMRPAGITPQDLTRLREIIANGG